MKIAVGGIHTECSTYSPLLQTMDDFLVAEGADLLHRVGLEGDRFSHAVFSPLFHARSVPGGPVAQECYQAFKARFLKALEASKPLNGVLLIMHGAMHVPGLEDPEGDWISAVRTCVGPETPIAVSYDLHGNVTQKIVDQIDIFCAYRTAPHIDVKQTHQKAARLLLEQLNGGPCQGVAWVPIPLLLPGERTSTEDEPAKSLYAKLAEHDLRPGVSDANLMVGYVWADTSRATAAAVVTGTDLDSISKTAEDIALDYWSAREDFRFGVSTASLSVCLDEAEACRSFPFVLADSGDNPTGGGVGDRNDVLRAWLDRGLQGAIFAGIADPAVVEKAWEVAEGTNTAFCIGGGFGSQCRDLHVNAAVVQKLGHKSNHDREILLSVAGNHVVVTERRRPFHNLDDFRKFGIAPEACKYLVVKSGYLSPELAPLANPAWMALTEGAVNQDIEALANTSRPDPSFPFQRNFNWAPKARLSQNRSASIDNHFESR